MIHAPIQLDMFAGPLFDRTLPQPAPIGAPAIVRRLHVAVPAGHPDEGRTWEECRARYEALRAAGKVERLALAPKGRAQHPSAMVELLHDAESGGWRTRTSYSTCNAGGQGPFGYTIHASRDEALLSELRGFLRRAASQARFTDQGAATERKHFDQIAGWAIAQAPTPIMGGPDLAAEYAAMQVEAKERAQRHASAVKIVHDLAEQLYDALRAIGVAAYGGGWDAGLICNADAPADGGAGADPAGHALRWPATWHICGQAPDALRVELRPRTGQHAAPTVLAALDAMRAAVAVPVELESEEDPAPYASYGHWTCA